MADLFGRSGFEDELDGLETSISGAAAITAAFKQELRLMNATMADANREMSTMRSGITSGLRRAIDGVILDGDRLSDALKGLGESMINAAYAAAWRPVTAHMGGVISNGIESFIGSLLPFQHGGSFTQGRVMPFANGGIVSSPIMFPMRGATGLMGEAGPEAIMPLARGADGRLGVQAQGTARPVNVVMNIRTPDVEGFRRSQSQIATQLSRSLSRANRNG